MDLYCNAHRRTRVCPADNTRFKGFLGSQARQQSVATGRGPAASQSVLCARGTANGNLATVAAMTSPRAVVLASLVVGLRVTHYQAAHLTLTRVRLFSNLFKFENEKTMFWTYFM